ncbi:MAG: hypothetical protein AAB414_00705 [Patescibacteria group bacterium]
MNTTQDHIPIKDIVDDMVLLKTGGGALVLQVSAVNFGLLSEREQLGIIVSFAQMLNSLSFSIQIMIHSKRLNISSYLNLLDKAQQTQTNTLLSKMMVNYRLFIQTLIKEREVLDKKFYVVIPLFKLELGLITSRETLRQKIKTTLLPRRDQVIRQLARAGLKATQLTSDKLTELFFDIYNEASFAPIHSRQTQPATLKSPQVVKTPKKEPPPSMPPPITRPSISKTHPFVVEELEEG